MGPIALRLSIGLILTGSAIAQCDPHRIVASDGLEGDTVGWSAASDGELAIIGGKEQDIGASYGEGGVGIDSIRIVEGDLSALGAAVLGPGGGQLA